MYKKQHLATSLFLHPCKGITSHAWGWRALVSTLSATLSRHFRDVNALHRRTSSCRIIRNRLNTYRSHLRSCRTAPHGLSARVSTWRALVVAINQALNSQHPYTPRRERSRAELTFGLPVPPIISQGPSQEDYSPPLTNLSRSRWLLAGVALASGRDGPIIFSRPVPKNNADTARVSLRHRATIYIADTSRARELRCRPR